MCDQSFGALARWLEQGRLQPPQIRDLGGLSVATVRAAHQLLEDGHGQGKLVMTLK